MQLLTDKEVAKMLGLKPATIKHWVSRRAIPYMKIGGRVRFTQDMIEQWAESKKVCAIDANI